MTQGEKICTRCGRRGHVAASCKRPSWLPTETQVRAAIERQRAEALRHGSRLAGPESVYVPMSSVQRARWAVPTLTDETQPRPWWSRLFEMFRLPGRSGVQRPNGRGRP